VLDMTRGSCYNWFIEARGLKKRGNIVKVVKIGEARGYWETWQRPCGHTYRVTTEYLWSSKKALSAARKQFASAPCVSCVTEIQD